MSVSSKKEQLSARAGSLLEALDAVIKAHSSIHEASLRDAEVNAVVVFGEKIISIIEQSSPRHRKTVRANKVVIKAINREIEQARSERQAAGPSLVEAQSGLCYAEKALSAATDWFQAV